MIANIEWIHINMELPAPGEWVVVYNPRDGQDQPEAFPAVLVETPRGHLWRVLIAAEDEIQYAPLNKHCMWARIPRP